MLLAVAGFICAIDTSSMCEYGTRMTRIVQINTDFFLLRRKAGLFNLSFILQSRIIRFLKFQKQINLLNVSSLSVQSTSSVFPSCGLYGYEL